MGVPQGSILSVTLFSIKINSILKGITIFTDYKYSDDMDFVTVSTIP
jgi:hypothetical protein